MKLQKSISRIKERILHDRHQASALTYFLLHVGRRVTCVEEALLYSDETPARIIPETVILKEVTDKGVVSKVT